MFETPPQGWLARHLDNKVHARRNDAHKTQSQEDGDAAATLSTTCTTIHIRTYIYTHTLRRQLCTARSRWTTKQPQQQARRPSPRQLATTLLRTLLRCQIPKRHAARSSRCSRPPPYRYQSPCGHVHPCRVTRHVSARNWGCGRAYRFIIHVFAIVPPRLFASRLHRHIGHVNTYKHAYTHTRTGSIRLRTQRPYNRRPSAPQQLQARPRRCLLPWDPRRPCKSAFPR